MFVLAAGVTPLLLQVADKMGPLGGRIGQTALFAVWAFLLTAWWRPCAIVAGAFCLVEIHAFWTSRYGALSGDVLRELGPTYWAWDAVSALLIASATIAGWRFAEWRRVLREPRALSDAIPPTR